MRVEVPSSELGAFCRVPVCIGCHRRATGVGRVRLSTVRGGTASGGGDDGVTGAVALVAAVADFLGWASSAKTVVIYPTCWRHRWINRPPLRLESTDGGLIVLDGVSAEFLAEWEARRAGSGEVNKP